MTKRDALGHLLTTLTSVEALALLLVLTCGFWALASVSGLFISSRPRRTTSLIGLSTSLVGLGLALCLIGSHNHQMNLIAVTLWAANVLPIMFATLLALALVTVTIWVKHRFARLLPTMVIAALSIFLIIKNNNIEFSDELNSKLSMLPEAHRLIDRTDLDPEPIQALFNGIPMQLVPAGPFLQGSLDTAQKQSIIGSPMGDEYPMETRELGAFWIDTYEVTIAQFSRFVAATERVTVTEQLNAGRRWTPEEGWILAEGLTWRNPMFPEDNALERPDHPVTQVTWPDAHAYCQWRDARLPTVAEWEKAARGYDGRRFPWGNEFDPSKANSCGAYCYKHGLLQEAKGDDGYRFTAPVGSFPEGVSPYGAYDMAGNVWEFVADFYDPYYFYYAPRFNPQGPRAGTHKIVKGGSFLSASSYLRTSSKSFDPLDEAYFGVGFRCAKNVD